MRLKRQDVNARRVAFEKFCKNMKLDPNNADLARAFITGWSSGRNYRRTDKIGPVVQPGKTSH